MALVRLSRPGEPQAIVANAIAELGRTVARRVGTAQHVHDPTATT